MPIKVAKARMENEHLRRRIGIFSVVNFAAALGPTQSHLAKRIHGLGWSNQLGRGWQKQNMVIRRHCLPLAVMNLEFYNATTMYNIWLVMFIGSFKDNSGLTKENSGL